MIKSAAHFFSGVMQRWLPDAFLFAVILSAIVFVCGLSFESQSVSQMADYWGQGFWKLLGFSMQMLLILVLGHTLAMSEPVVKLLRALASIAATPVQAVILVTVVSTLAAWLNWGFGLVVGALVARELGQRLQNVHFPLLVAAAYSGFLVWHAGLSGSIPLKIASTNQDALAAVLGGAQYPVSETIFATENLIIVVALLISLPLLNMMMHPDKEQVVKFNGKPVQKKTIDQHSLTPAEKLEHLPWINLLLAVICGFYLIRYFVEGGGINLNIINMLLLVFGLLLHRTPDNFLTAINQAIRGAAGIVVQFPLYAGIMGMMVKSGLAASLSGWFVEISTAQTFPLFTFLSAGIVNFFVPSGGGQWAVQAPVVIPAAQNLGVSVQHAAMAVAWGDAWTNMIQPFWALPLLGIAGLNIRQIMGYCTVILLWSGALILTLMSMLY